MDNRSGCWKNNLTDELSYKSFLPAKLPPIPVIELDEDTLKLLINANKELAYLEGLSSRVQSLSLFVSMYVRKEALLSSQIEGTQCTLEDVLDPTIDANQNRDVSDVINYTKATEYALKRLAELPLCNRLIKETHEILMSEVRGKEKSPGKFRTSQNCIGGTSSNLSNAMYIPPSPEDMVICMSDLEKYMNSEDDETDPLIKAGLIHYQFETIHPFLDGNGRIGRLLITLFLIQNNLLTTPTLYISCFLKSNRIEYYDRLSEVRKKGNYEQWLKFFLQAVYESSKDAIFTIEELSNLHDDNIKKLLNLSRNQNLLLIFNYLEKNPIIDIKKTSLELGVVYNTVSRAVHTFIELGILKEYKKTGKTRTYSYESYLDILRRDTI